MVQFLSIIFFGGGFLQFLLGFSKFSFFFVSRCILFSLLLGWSIVEDQTFLWTLSVKTDISNTTVEFPLRILTIKKTKNRQLGFDLLNFLPSWISWFSWPLKTGPIGCSETSASNYHCTLCNISEERRSQWTYSLFLVEFFP